MMFFTPSPGFPASHKSHHDLHSGTSLVLFTSRHLMFFTPSPAFPSSHSQVIISHCHMTFFTSSPAFTASQSHGMISPHYTMFFNPSPDFLHATTWVSRQPESDDDLTPSHAVLYPIT
jgi:hypothetical protein